MRIRGIVHPDFPSIASGPIAHFPIADHKHGFRKQHRTTTALHAITAHISRGFNQNKPAYTTVLVAIDLSKAFETFSHATLFEDIALMTFTFLESHHYLTELKSYHTQMIVRL